ncbi:nicotinamide riboside transporter PnuC [Helicobacter brantae]|uniref:Nicotinamide riboside transporter PnuC n=1 Tax=Helicobacter brantae TaxID=375927 RepID=A0A3D8J4M0_9HELI|nr:nicotinamide riboside transporter PnuC [Helicobacter brantae]RDU71711.1 nicotinamide riboside transporter PnuC [Helicobacter brantae]
MQFLKSQFGNLSLKFYSMLFVVCGLLVVLSIMSGGGVLSIIVALCGILYAFFAGEGKYICFFFGLVYSCLYAYIAYEIGLYGDMMLNIFYLPINLLGIFWWKSHQNQERDKIIITSLSPKGKLLCASVVLGLSVGYGAYLQSIHSLYPYLNAFSVVAQVVAFYLQVKRYVQNYFLVTLANIVSIVIWGLIYDVSQEQIAQLLTMIIFFFVGVYYYFAWRREV